MAKTINDLFFSWFLVRRRVVKIISVKWFWKITAWGVGSRRLVFLREFKKELLKFNNTSGDFQNKLNYEILELKIKLLEDKDFIFYTEFFLKCGILFRLANNYFKHFKNEVLQYKSLREVEAAKSITTADACILDIFELKEMLSDKFPFYSEIEWSKKEVRQTEYILKYLLDDKIFYFNRLERYLGEILSAEDKYVIEQWYNSFLTRRQYFYIRVRVILDAIGCDETTTKWDIIKMPFAMAISWYGVLAFIIGIFEN